MVNGLLGLISCSSCREGDRRESYKDSEKEESKEIWALNTPAGHHRLCCPPPPDSAEDLRTVPPSAASEGKHWVSVLILWKRVWSQVSGPWPLDAGQWSKHHSPCLGLLMARVGFSHLWPWHIKEEFNTDLLSPIDDFKELLALEVFQQVCV